MIAIYGLIDPRDCQLRYVGKSANPKRRLADHILAARGGDKVHCRRWVAGVVVQGMRPEIMILQECSVSEANEAECHWIGYFRMIGADLTNRTAGGDGLPRGFVMPEASRLAMLAKITGRTRSPEVRARMKAAFNRPEVRALRRSLMLARMADPAQRAIAQRGATGHRHTAEAKARISAARRKAVA